jgi:hypothetical protein
MQVSWCCSMGQKEVGGKIYTRGRFNYKGDSFGSFLCYMLPAR